MTEQNNNILTNKVYAFIWSRWSWKTMLSSVIWNFKPYKKVFSNFDLNYKNKEVVRYRDFDLYDKVKTTDLEKKLLIFDEWWINANSRNFASKINKLLSFFIFVSRKYNIDIIFISQDFETFDKNIRRQTDFLFEIKSFLPKNIDTTIWKMEYWQKKFMLGTYSIDTLKLLENYNIKYDTRDLSGFEEKLKTFF